MRAMSGSAELADHLGELPELLGGPFAEEDDFVERFSDLPVDPGWTNRQPDREVALLESSQSREKLTTVEAGGDDCRSVGHRRLPRSSPPFLLVFRRPAPHMLETVSG